MNDYIKAVKFETNAAVSQQCDQPRLSNKYKRKDVRNNSYVYASMIYALRSHRLPSNRSKHVQRGFNFSKFYMTFEELGNATNTRACAKCGKYRHWYKIHNAGGSLSPNIPSSDYPYVVLECSIQKSSDTNHSIHHQCCLKQSSCLYLLPLISWLVQWLTMALIIWWLATLNCACLPVILYPTGMEDQMLYRQFSSTSVSSNTGLECIPARLVIFLKL